MEAVFKVHYAAVSQKEDEGGGWLYQAVMEVAKPIQTGKREVGDMLKEEEMKNREGFSEYPHPYCSEGADSFKGKRQVQVRRRGSANTAFPLAF